ncbi:MAG TPA: type II toxin-antitoxin system RelE/ParE family toxin [Bacteroidales bacterium]|nr:type II toxin-antitoxin system RelE/ParE family toxin [Bacteroidales bacterium]
MNYSFPVIWSEEAVRNLEETLDYLVNRWTQREVNNFKTKLSRQLNLISQNPKLFPVSGIQPRLRKAVLSSQTTIFYEFKNDSVYIVYLFNNAKNPDKIK